MSNYTTICSEDLKRGFNFLKKKIKKEIKNNKSFEGFKYWGISNEHGWSLAHIYIRYKPMPSDFTDYDICDKNGWSVAHEGAIYDHLPQDFKLWGLSDKNGLSVSHIYIKYRPLPTDFTGYDIADRNGWTVAHQGAKYNNLPVYIEESILWLSTKKGVSVKKVIEDRISLDQALNNINNYANSQNISAKKTKTYSEYMEELEDDFESIDEVDISYLHMSPGLKLSSNMDVIRRALVA